MGRLECGSFEVEDSGKELELFKSEGKIVHKEKSAVR